MIRRHLLALLAAIPLALPATGHAASAEPTGPQPDSADRETGDRHP